MQATLITRDPGASTTRDLTLDLVLPGHGKQPRKAIDTVPASEWSTSSAGAHAHPGAASESAQLDPAYRPLSLSSLSPFGSDEPNEFATYVHGREAWLGNAELRDTAEEELRRFSERSEKSEGYLLTTSLSSGFSGLTPAFLELVRDEFAGPKGSVWVTGMIADARGWRREDNERSRSQRLLNAALSLPSLEDLSSMVLPVQPPSPFDPTEPWARYLRQDGDWGTEDGRVRQAERVREVMLQGAGEELREPDALPSLIAQLNWRGTTKIAHLSGVAPLPPAPYFSDGAAGMKRLRESWRDWSVLPAPPKGEDGVRPRPAPATPFAQYSIVRGLSFDESQTMGPLLEKAVEPLQEPFSRWVSLEPPYPLLPSSPAIFSGLHPASGHPLVLPTPSLPSSLFGAPDPSFPPASSFVQQPSSIPILTTLSTTPDARYLLRSLSLGVRELKRTRAAVVREYEGGEYGVGSEGVEEARERLETLVDTYGGEEEGEEGKDEDENWEGTMQEEEWDL
ncbi:hypothetical protein JCM10207_002702 [Rhodosporidiobolus poonsookiae]